MSGARFQKIEDPAGDVIGFTFEGALPEELEEMRQPVALAFDARHTYSTIGDSIDVIWLESDTAMELEGVGVLELAGTDCDEVPQPVRVGDRSNYRSIFLYKLPNAGY